MDQIRSKMMQHEALFKEQVQALHKLYHIQRLAMQEIRSIYSHAQVLAYSSERIFADDQLHGSILEGKPLRPAYASGRACEEESLACSLHPFFLFKEFKSSASVWMNDRKIENSHTARKKPMRNFDLEKLPEDFMDEPEIHFGSNNSEAVDVKSVLSQRTENTKDYCVVQANLSSIDSESQSLKQICSETDLRLFTATSQEFNQNGDQASEARASKSDFTKYVMNSWNSSNTTEKNASKEVEWNLSSDGRITTGSKSEQLNNCSAAGVYLPNNCYQDNINFCLGNQNLQLSASISQTIMDGSNDNPKDSSDGSNSALSQDTTSSKNKIDSADVEDTHGLGDSSSDKGKTSRNGVGIVESEHKESPQLIQDGVKPSFCLNSEPEKMSSLDEAIVNDSNEDVTGKSAELEESENIAVEILLSFAPCRKFTDSKFHCSQSEAESGKSSRVDNYKKPSLPEMRNAKDGIIDSIKWAKSVSRRRTSRRPR
ncbi:hypothetical protein Pint_12491 [Pistacia integerrima]|uniref:Uncharacterized protein n=1 Tax=Pistacia integerrima TaxID=434235 RepID=A0ACC0Y926_9ROSI|nr:hypothetical protein Pint_12491 [Pistacia integerrima]